MDVHAYTFREDDLSYTNSFYKEAKLYFDAGVDAVHCEFPHQTYDAFLDLSHEIDWSGYTYSQALK